MPKKSSGPAPHQILFAGQSAEVTLVDGRLLTVFVRELPARYHTHVFQAADHLALLVELCTYERETAGAPAPAAAYPEVRPPTGYRAVPAGWADNLHNDSLHALYDLAQKLNFTSAAATGNRQLAAKEWKVPLIRAAEAALLPLVEQLSSSLISSLTARST